MTSQLNVFSFYRFVRLPDFEALQLRIQNMAVDHGLLGTILLANEGINGSVVGTRPDIEEFLESLGDIDSLAGLYGRWTLAVEPPFKRMRVKLRPEIVTLGRPDLDPAEKTGLHVSPDEWNKLLAREDVLLIDTRNDYEIDVGRFPGAINPHTDNFREFPDYIDAELGEYRDRPVAMYCTGGIRCEKAAALMLEKGFSEVYQLQGGVLAYLDEMNEQENQWQGECFVFDSRVAVDAELSPGNYVQCHACRRPLSAADMRSDLYEEGLSCPACHGTIDPEKLTALRERRKQNALRRSRHEAAQNALSGAARKPVGN